MADFLTGNVIVATKSEATAGTAETVTTTECDVKFLDVGAVEVDPHTVSPGKVASGKAGTVEQICTYRTSSATLKWNSIWSGAIGTEPKWGKLMETCGFQVITESTAKGYELAGNFNCKTLTMSVRHYACGSSPTGRNYTIKGAVGSGFKVSADNVGSPVVFEAKFDGATVATADIASATPWVLTSPDTAAPDLFIGSAVTLGALNLSPRSFAIETGTKSEYQIFASDSSGYSKLTDMEIKGTISVKSTDQSTHAYDAAQVGNTDYATLVIPTAHFTHTLTTVRITGIKVVDNGGISGYELEFNAQAYKVVQKA